MGGNPDADTTAIERAVVALRRAQRRRGLARLAERRGERTGEAGRLPDGVFELLDALESATEQGAALTVTEAATALGIDQPRASRLAAQAVETGLLRREADQRDGRRSLLALTPDGRSALGRIHAFRGRVFAEATADWTEADRAALARLLPRLVRDLAALSDPGAA